MTGGDLLREIQTVLENGNIENARFDGAQIVSHTLSKTPSQIMTDDEEVSKKEYETALSLADRRLENYPLQYLLGSWEFYSLPFRVGEGVLIPRPETELLVDMAVDYISDAEGLRIIDLCSGSGCVAVAIEQNVGDCSVFALEKSEDAFSYLEENIKLNHSEVVPVLGDIFDGTDETYDLIVSNPPYINKNDMENLDPELYHEPQDALFGGDDGLDFYRVIAKKWVPALNPGGAVMLEIGYDQKDAVSEILTASGITAIECIKDLSGFDRVIIGTMPA